MTFDTDHDDTDEFLVELEQLRDEDPEAAQRQLAAAPSEVARRPEARLLAADLAWELGGPAAARPLLEALVEAVPDYADARHVLGTVYEDLGETKAKIEQFLEVFRLDQGLDQDLDPETASDLEDAIVDAAESTILKLPETFRERLANVPIFVEARPNEELVGEGLDPRALGLIEGPTHAEAGSGDLAELPTRITLYSANLLAESVDEDQLRDEVRVTVLHEVGHYFGLEEDDMERLGLD
jgi:predicted Zn-dependent protease with MMP-like domain